MVPTVERGLRLVDFWSMDTAGDRPSMKSTSGLSIWPRNCREYAASDSTYRRWPSAKIVSNASDDLPDPDSPVNTIKASRGRSRSTLRRLCSRAPLTIRRSATRFPPADRIHAHAMSTHRQLRGRCRPTLGPPLPRGDNVSTMTVVDDNYTGHVEPRTAARRTLPAASIVKVSVGPMDNNAYLVTCSRTGETLLIDAAHDADILLDPIESYAPKLALIVPSHQHQDHWLALDAVAKATGVPTAAHRLDSGPLPVKPDR